MSQEEYQKQPSKVVHLDPFAQLQRALLQGKGEANNNEQNQQKIPLHQTICHSTIQYDELVHETYTPISYSKQDKTQIKQKYPTVTAQTQFEREVQKIYQQQESIVLSVHYTSKIIKVLKIFTQFCNRGGKRFIMVSNNKQDSFILQNLLAQALKDYEILQEVNQSNHQSIFCWFTTLHELRKATFQQMSALNRFDWVTFQDMDLGNPIFEEILITLPLQLNYHLIYTQVMENIHQVMNWLAKLRDRPFHLVYDKQQQILPLIYGMTAKSKGMYQLANNSGETNHSSILKINQSLQINEYPYIKNKKNQTFQHNLKDIIKLLYSLDKFPIVCLASSKRNVEKYARMLCQSIDLTSKEQKQTIQLYFSTCVSINPQLKGLKIFNTAREYLARGIGMYHQGLLPTLREIVLLLSKKRLLKVIVANQLMPFMDYRSVVINQDKSQNKKSFTDFKQNIDNITKLDKPEQKLVLWFFQDKIDQQQLWRLISKQKRTVNSMLDLNLYTYLNYLSFEDMDAEYVLARSFKQMQNYHKVEQLKSKQNYLQRQIDHIVFENVEPVKALHLCKQRKKELERQILKRTNSPQNVIPYLSVGRLLHLQSAEVDWGMGVVVNFVRLEEPKNQINYFLDALVHVKDGIYSSGLEPAQMSQNGRLQVVTFDLSCIKSIKTVQFTQLPNNLKQPENKSLILRSLKKVQTYDLNSVKIELNDKQSVGLKKELTTVANELSKLQYLQPIYCEYLNRSDLQNKLTQTKLEIKNLSAIVEKDKLKIMHKLAKHMDYVSKKRLTKTGKAVGCFQSRYGIMIVELMKENLWEKFSGTELAALMVSLVEDQRVNTQRLKVPNLRLREGLNLMIEKTKEICKILRKQKLQINQEQQIELIKQQYMDAIMRGCEGLSIDQICDANSIYEGTLLQIVNKLMILLQQMKKASSILQLKGTQLKIDEAMTRLSQMNMGSSDFSILL